ncbi:MAG TPA: inorganic diphosphatase [Xanthobacteraceae bacterium]|nr:inorganic diphosphatase [Xanthobacteraceae bacterium]
MSFHNLTLGKKAPEFVNAVVEIPKGCACKFEYDEAIDEIKLDRVLHSSMHYPVDYGFIPSTRSDDGDHLDVLIAVSAPLFPGCVVSVRPVGAVDMEDEAGQDWKIVAVAEHDPRLRAVASVDDLGRHFKLEVRHFLEEYKRLENKWVRVKGWLGKDDAYRLIRSAADRFKNERQP